MQIRRAAQYISNKNKRPLLAAEIGVRSGENMLAMLQEMNLRALFLVDPYLPYDDGGCYQTKEMQDINRANMLYRASGYFERIVLFFQKSHQAVRLIPDKYFDYVYIDGSHDYEDVKLDLELWLNKIKEGGILAGHDYNSIVAWPGVTKAIDEFVKKRNLTIVDCKDSDWYIDQG